MPKNQAVSCPFDLQVDPADGFGSPNRGRRTTLAHAAASVYNGADPGITVPIRDGQRKSRAVALTRSAGAPSGVFVGAAKVMRGRRNYESGKRQAEDRT